ncbi:MAG TPA: TetR/AcrR family transcriptional regulator [Solirubrobacteraceae bacterium]|jgi:AcrR family transcriptional regulator|nr:TetR/AcrR family transcriptional regulator [Solirubrobacteraceae bacterium]
MTPTKDRIVTASAELFRRGGYTGTGLKRIAAEAQAPFGSIYHFFPGGKEELGAETVRWSGARFGDLVPAVFDPAPDVVTAVRRFFAGAAEHLEDSGWVDACPIATVALEVSSVSEPLREACADVFADWIASASARLAEAGIAEDRARELAIGMVAALEGAFVLARALRSTEPLEVAGAQAADAVQRALAPH